MALKRLCRCGKAIDYNKKYCNKCEAKYKQEKAQSNRYYDKNIRDKKATAFYKSKEWLKTREYILRKYKGLDLYAFFIEKKIVYANTVHHIEEIKDNWERRLDIKNLFPVSGGRTTEDNKKYRNECEEQYKQKKESTHNIIHAMYEKDKKGTQRLLFDLLNRWKKEYM